MERAGPQLGVQAPGDSGLGVSAPLLVAQGGDGHALRCAGTDLPSLK